MISHGKPSTLTEKKQHMRLIKSFLFAGLIASVSFGATVTASSTKIGGESSSACSSTQTSTTAGKTAKCVATFVSGSGGAISSFYSDATGSYNWLGAVTRTQAITGYSIRSQATANFASEFNAQNASGHGVVVTYDSSGGIGLDLEAVVVQVKDAFGDYQTVATLSDGDSYTVNYSGTPIDILLTASEEGTGVLDSTNLFHIDLSAF
jgi:hypothetical protein